MHPYPHQYKASSQGGPIGDVAVTAQGLSQFSSAPPPEFDGPGGYWSPETLLCAALADCFVLTFRAIARASKFEWAQVSCEVEGTLDRAAGGARFVRFVNRVQLTVAGDVDEAKARLLLEKAEHNCLIANSVSAERRLEATVLRS